MLGLRAFGPVFLGAWVASERASRPARRLRRLDLLLCVPTFTKHLSYKKEWRPVLIAIALGETPAVLWFMVEEGTETGSRMIVKGERAASKAQRPPPSSRATSVKSANQSFLFFPERVTGGRAASS